MFFNELLNPRDIRADFVSLQDIWDNDRGESSGDDGFKARLLVNARPDDVLSSWACSPESEEDQGEGHACGHGDEEAGGGSVFLEPCKTEGVEEHRVGELHDYGGSGGFGLNGGDFT